MTCARRTGENALDIDPTRPPESIDAGAVLLRRTHPADADPIARAVKESLDHLMPWLSWATPAATTSEAQLERILQLNRDWEAGAAFGYSVLSLDRQTLLGTCGLDKRLARDAAEIGYWIHADHVNRGYATAAAEAVTKVAWGLRDVQRVEIHCNEANLASRAVPRHLGYRMDRLEDEDVDVPGAVGRKMVWTMDRPSSSVGWT